MARLTDAELAIDVLQRAGVRISKPGAWKQRRLARTETGRPVPSLDPDAVGWSLRGAVHVHLAHKHLSQARENRIYKLVFRGLEAAHRVRHPEGGWEEWHDEKGRRRTEVLRLIDQAVLKIKEHDRTREAA